MLIDHVHKKFEINRTKIKGGCQSGRKVVPHNSKSDLPLNLYPKCLTTLKAGNLNLLYLGKKEYRLETLLQCQQLILTIAKKPFMKN